jgi:HK97 family phage major capsid protein
MDRLKEIEKRLAEIREKLTAEDENVDIDALEKEVRELQDEKADLIEKEKRQKIAKKIKDGEIEGRFIAEGKEEPPEVDKAEKRGKDLMEKRSVTVSTSNVLLPEHKATDIKPTFNEVSSLIDRVNIKPLMGGESYEQPYLVGYGEGGYTDEEGLPTDAEPSFNYATINKTKITAYAEDTEELQKLPAADYDAEVMKGISTATRKKITKEILIGNGTTGHFVGIFDDGATAIDGATDKSMASIDENTLDEIIYSFGGDEDVEDQAVLILNKLDLKEFATLRHTDGTKVYDVVHNGNTGTIDGVPYVINSACNAISDGAVTAGQYSMAYGPLSNYTMAIFSEMEVKRSTDYKFKEGMIAHRGVVFSGGNVTAKNGFLRVKKG